MPIEDQLAQIHTPQDLSAFIAQLLQDYYDHPEAWENRDLPAFLEAMAAWIKDTAKSQPQPPTWQAFAEMLLAASMYE
jgi:hypothetical protein